VVPSESVLNEAKNVRPSAETFVTVRSTMTSVDPYPVDDEGEVAVAHLFARARGLRLGGPFPRSRTARSPPSGAG
jgi:hypothetical protein